ncbi:MAG: hypothetical protein HQM11_06340 [SAR324 cluster bacterium]|nr:hypothetical protein [SAR324 cluster bacterium]
MAYVLASPIPEALGIRVFEKVSEIRNNPDIMQHADAIVRLLCEISEVTLNYYFLRPLDLIHAGNFGQRLVTMGIQTSVGLTRTTSGRLLRQMDSTQLLKFAQWVEDTIVIEQSGRYMLACPVGPGDAEMVFEVVRKIRKNPVKHIHTDQTVNAAVEITRISLNHFAIEPLNLMRVGAFGHKLVDMAIHAGLGILRMTGPKLVNPLEGEDLIAFAGFFEGLMVPVDQYSFQKHFEVTSTRSNPS